MTRPAPTCPVSRALTLDAAAERLGLTEADVRGMMLLGQLEGVVVRGRQRVSEMSVKNAAKAAKYRTARQNKTLGS